MRNAYSKDMQSTYTWTLGGLITSQDIFSSSEFSCKKMVKPFGIRFPGTANSAR